MAEILQGLLYWHGLLRHVYRYRYS